MHNVEAIKPHLYRNKRRSIGDRYSVENKQDLRLLTALGWVKAAPVTIPEAEITNFYSGGYLTRVMEAEEKPKRTYTRRKKVEE